MHMDDNKKIKFAIIICVFCVFSLIYYNSQQVTELKSFTELYFENASIPFILNSSEIYNISFVVNSKERESMNYTYAVLCGDANYSNYILLKPNENKTIPISFSASATWGTLENSSEIASEGVYTDEIELSKNTMIGNLILNNESSDISSLFAQKLRTTDLSIIRNVSINYLRNNPLTFNYIDETISYADGKKTQVNTTVTIYIVNNTLISTKAVTAKSVDWLIKNCTVTLVDSNGVIQNIYLNYKSN